LVGLKPQHGSQAHLKPEERGNVVAQEEGSSEARQLHLMTKGRDIDKRRSPVTSCSILDPPLGKPGERFGQSASRRRQFAWIQLWIVDRKLHDAGGRGEGN